MTTKTANNRLSIITLMACLSLTHSLMAACRTEAEIPSTTPDTDFTDNGDGTITHIPTGLMWMKCSLGQSGANCMTGAPVLYTWSEALQTAATMQYAGYSDWRLPNKNELLSLVEYRCDQPSINSLNFPNTYPRENSSDKAMYWTSTPSSSPNTGQAWSVTFFYGGAVLTGTNGINDIHYARLVRSGSNAIY